MLFSEVADVPKGPKVVAVGSFDGVHLGHQYLLRQALSEAKTLKAPLLVYTFDPPTKVFTRGEGFLMDLQEKVEALREVGVELILAVPFNEEFARRPPEAFLEDLRALQASRIYVGEDFRFGQGRAGGPEALERVAPTRVVPLLSLGGEAVKSSRIRALLREGRVEEARHLLGRLYGAYGVVVEGDKLGRKLGFPTANLAVHPQKILPPGVFAVEAQGSFGRYKGVANVGTRPTVNGMERRLEVHLLGFAGELYGEEMRLSFLKRLREEKRFDSLEELKAQIAKDVASARAYFGL
ncbi:riboflavin biosynthesis protein [Thermus thermophilus]|uniref:riboflavin biosynthesis protein RibF n=1 Tax=Thermus thermophilus TaxID=274 RepID=UPI001FCABD8E|nr:riboflavin biosynthesis protein RibF [Thermus thermophilus]BDG26886.1 riboflavin biosynthesis protein [Thermus thermophilus]